MAVTFNLPSPESVQPLIERLKGMLIIGDTLLLDGPVGAGKTHFARNLIQSYMRDEDSLDDVPSPTFTLVQTYEFSTFDIWHADLYRLNSLDEIYELGLEQSFETAICLVEWPDRLGPLKPETALTLTFGVLPDDRHQVTFTWTSQRWEKEFAT